MAIQSRRGLSADLDATKLLPGEYATPSDADPVVCQSPGVSKTLATREYLANLLETSPEAYLAMQQLVTDLESNPSELTNILNNITVLQSGKLDKTGDAKDNTVTFAIASTDTDITTGDKISIAFGKILKRFGSIATALGLKQSTANMVQSDTLNDATKYPSSAVTYAHGLEIDTINNNLAKIGTVYSNTITSVPAVIANSWTQLHSIAVPNGTYVVTASLEYSSTINGRVILGVGNSISEIQTGYNGINGGYTIRCTIIVTVAGGTIKLGCYYGIAFTPNSVGITAVRLS